MKWGTSRRFTPEEAAEAARLYWIEGESLCEVGRILGRDPSSVRVLFVRQNIPLRDAKQSYRQWCERRKQRETDAIADVLSEAIKAVLT